LHQALEAKEGVKINKENKTLASITFQNLFRMYWKLGGMTGTAKTEEEEFYKVYGLETLIIPTNKPILREDKIDLLFKNEEGKIKYIVNMIKELTKTGQTILVGTVSVDKSEYLSNQLIKVGIKHNVLNAKQNQKEAEIIEMAGKKGAITIATNMAGRGTDIKLGEGVIELGGLIIIGTEKHETRRIDNQLKGRAGRQGNPGMTQFLISPNDDIMRIFGGDKIFGIFNSPVFSSIPDEQPIFESKMLTKKVINIQKQVEGHNFDARKHVLEYDDVINKHRTIIYNKRNKILDAENVDEDIKKMLSNQIKKIVFAEIAKVKEGEDINKKELIIKINDFLGIEAIDDTIENDDIFGMTNAKEIRS
ncbi:MAG: helicase-related protein, partial [Candidatus Gracilibacteria bacterium]|nr:helicase-related protein [Candidatus Gracilibacteria bacterium]